MQRLGINQEEIGGFQHKLSCFDGFPELPDFAGGEDNSGGLGALHGRGD